MWCCRFVRLIYTDLGDGFALDILGLGKYDGGDGGLLKLKLLGSPTGGDGGGGETACNTGSGGSSGSCDAKTSCGIFSGDVGTVDGDDGLGNGFQAKLNNELIIGSNNDARVGGLSSVSIICCSVCCGCIGIATLALVGV